LLMAYVNVFKYDQSAVLFSEGEMK
jgi:hypothetical protein